jgi:hypothetical protein
MSFHVFLILACSLFLLGCQARPPVALATDATSAKGPEYDAVSMATLGVGNDVKVRATLEELKQPVEGLPHTRLVMKNLSTGKILYEAESGNCSLSNPNFWVERGTALVETCWGGSGGSLRVYEVSDSEVRVALEDAFREGAIMMPNDELGGDMGFLILDNESGADPLQARRYQYNREKKQYVLTGTTDFAGLTKSIKAQFNKLRR